MPVHMVVIMMFAIACFGFRMYMIGVLDGGIDEGKRRVVEKKVQGSQCLHTRIQSYTFLAPIFRGRPISRIEFRGWGRSLLEIHIGVLTHYTSGVRNGRLCQELHLHSSAWWADVCQFQFTTLGWLKLVLNNILKTGWSHN